MPLRLESNPVWSLGAEKAFIRDVHFSSLFLKGPVAGGPAGLLGILLVCGLLFLLCSS